MSDDIIDLEPIDEPTTAAVAVIERGSALVRPAADLDTIADAFNAYQALRARLLTASDYQAIRGKQFPKKSAWRKLGVAFNVSCSIKERSYERDAAGKIIRAEFIITATAPNGRTMDGFGACDAFEKCDRKCKDDCTGFVHFSHPQHDIPATAETRAKNRAMSDLFGGGEVSAEEVSNDTSWWGGWETEAEFNTALAPIVEQKKKMSEAGRVKVGEWLVAHGYEAQRWVVAKDDFPAFKECIGSLTADELDPGRPFDDVPSTVQGKEVSGEHPSGVQNVAGQEPLITDSGSVPASQGKRGK